MIQYILEEKDGLWWCTGTDGFAKSFTTYEFAYECCVLLNKIERQYSPTFSYVYTPGDSIVTTKIEYQGSGWECELFGMGRQIVVNPNKEMVPCWFWRKMQYLFFGNVWIHVKSKEK